MSPTLRQWVEHIKINKEKCKNIYIFFMFIFFKPLNCSLSLLWFWLSLSLPPSYSLSSTLSLSMFLSLCFFLVMLGQSAEWSGWSEVVHSAVIEGCSTGWWWCLKSCLQKLPDTAQTFLSLSLFILLSFFYSLFISRSFSLTSSFTSPCPSLHQKQEKVVCVRQVSPSIT